MDIRPLRDDDFPEVVWVWRRSRLDAQPEIEARARHSEDDDLRHFRDTVAPADRVWVAEEDGRIVGVLTIDGERLNRLYVDPPAQGRGVGSALLAFARTLSPSGLCLFTHQTNARARAFYARHGFREVAFGVSPPPENEPDVQLHWEP